jgi:Fur family ferric uptake transcriptional regulator
VDTSLGADSPRVTAAVARLRSAGERVTPARYAVLRVIDAADLADEHLTSEQVGARVAAIEPAVHRATVYRTLTSLTEAGVLSHVHLGGTATVYHLSVPGPVGRHGTGGTDAGTAAYDSSEAVGPGADAHADHRHAHVQCVSCGHVQDVPPSALVEVADRLLDDLGFLLDTTHAALLGTCRRCRETRSTP